MKTVNQVVIGAFALLLAFAAHTLGQNTLQFTGIKATEEGAMLLSWQSDSDTLYRIEFANELSDQTVWETLTDFYPSHGTNTFILDTGDYFQTPAILHPRSNPSRFYRILNEGTNGAPPPQVAITSPTNGLIESGSVTITVAASTDQATLSTRLYVDGQEMRPPVDSTNYTANGTNYLNDNYVINSCEWPNGPHTLFAVAECASDFSGPLNVTPVQMGHAVSSYVPLTFSNLIARFSWSEPFFQPASGQTQIVSAVFAANVDWTLQVLDLSSNAVRTVTGSGISLQFAWDGNGDGGTNLPAGVYHYQLSAQTNGMAFSSSGDSEGGNSSLTSSANAGTVAEASADWYPTSPREALAAGLTSYFVQPPPMPPVRVETNGVWTYVPYEDVYGPQPLTEMQIPPGVQQRFLQSIAGSAQFNSASTPEPAGFGGPSSQSTTGPTRPPTAPMVNIIGRFAVGFQQYINPVGSGILLNPLMEPPLDGQPFPPGHRVQLMNTSGAVTITPIKDSGGEAANFGYEMWNAAWIQGFFKFDGGLYASDIRYVSSPFNTNNIGLLMLHGAYGTSADWYASQCQQIYFPLWSFGVQMDGTVTSREEWVRMSEMNFGSAAASGLKWMAIEACFSLRRENVQSMDAHFVYPFNSNLHFMLGVDTIDYADAGFAAKWARYMVYTNLPVWGSWLAAGKDSFKAVPPTVIINFAIWGHSGSFSDQISDINPPSGDLDYQREQVHPVP